MRLINVETMQFEEFMGDQPRYARLSHRWASPDQEISYQDYLTGTKQPTTGYEKIVNFCKLAGNRRYQYCWIDTCCIDKNNSAELSEAINSMYAWYEKAEVSIVYLSDLEAGGEISRSEWFERGWTLQELLAPRDTEFYNRDWRLVGDKKGLDETICSITGIAKEVLRGEWDIADYSVAQRMSWAAGRSTTRIEDQAYCLLGIFDISMPLLYGEGRKAFLRLQHQILVRHHDNSIFAWAPPALWKQRRACSLTKPLSTVSSVFPFLRQCNDGPWKP